MKVPGGREAGEHAGPWSMDGLTVATESCPRELFEFLILFTMRARIVITMVYFSPLTP